MPSENHSDSTRTSSKSRRNKTKSRIKSSNSLSKWYRWSKNVIHLRMLKGKQLLRVIILNLRRVSSSLAN